MKIKNNLPFDPKGSIFHWGPVPGKFLYCSVFVAVHYKYFRAKYKENWSETLWLFQNNRMFWVNDLIAIQRAGLKVFLKYLLPINSRKKIYKEWKDGTKKLVTIQKEIDQSDLQKLTNIQLKKLWDKFHKEYINFWVTGSVPELANYGSENYLKEKLKAVIKDENKLSDVMEVLTAPEATSFYQEEEIELLRTKNLKIHQQKYFWLKNSYAGTEVLPVEFFAELKNKLNTSLASQIKAKLIETVSRKRLIKKQFNLSTKIMELGEAISEGVVWQDERKKYVFMALHYQDVMLEEVSRRFKYSIEMLHRAWYFEIDEIIEGKNLHTKLNDRQAGFGVRFFHQCEELDANATENFWKTYETKLDNKITEIKGTVASKGKDKKVRGIVRVILDPTKVETFNDGEILVAPMTSPEYIFVMKKASAVITDTGGLTSHAAIVSRELNIPCIVGAKGATILFKNDDVVEIDVSSGIVKLVN